MLFRSLLLRAVLYACCALAVLQVSAQADSARWYQAKDGTKIYYEVKGTGYPVFLVHGFIVNSGTWKKSPLYLDLLKAGYKVVIMDLRGNGRSDKPHDPDAYANDAQAADIMGIAYDLGVSKYDVIGYSRGSIITARLLVLDNRVRKAVIGGMSKAFTDPEWPRRIMFYRALMGDSVPALRAIVQNVQRAGLDQLALAYQQKEQPSTSVTALSKLKKAVLVICGAEDEDKGIELAALIPGAIYKETSGDHNHAASTQQFADEVISFIRK
jgi:pimeloyl-ACP methyl ester carboxylesterase